MKEITTEQYLNNSGTRGLSDLYKTKSTKIERFEFRRLPNGLYQKVIIKESFL